MNYKQRPILQSQKSAGFLFAVFLLAGHVFAQSAAVSSTAALSTVEKDLRSKISVEAIKDVTAALSAEDMQGRGIMQPGGERAARYIAERFQRLGLKPLGDNGSYLQKIDFTETVLSPETAFKIGGENLKLGDEFGILPATARPRTTSGEMVFIAYGIVEDSTKRNNLQGIDVRGKIVVMLNGAPADIPAGEWEKKNLGQAVFENLMTKGVAGIVFIANGREARTPEQVIDYFSRRQISLTSENRGALQLPPLIFMNQKGAEKLFAKSDVALTDARAQAESTGFKPIELNQTATVATDNKTAEGTSSNVIGYLEGSDPTLKAEAVIFSAHYDAFGNDRGKIYHGAADNGLGVAEMISVAEAFSKMAIKPKRSLIFFSGTGEEYGLYGSKYWTNNPTWDIKRVAADLNFDGFGTEVYGQVKTVVGFGAQYSTVGATLADVSSAFGIKVIADPVPDEDLIHRSDHYSFIEKGVPGLWLLGAPEGETQVWIKRMKDWEKTDYHQPGDVIQPNWEWEGAKTIAAVVGVMGWRISESQKMPEWLPSSSFGKLGRGNDKKFPEASAQNQTEPVLSPNFDFKREIDKTTNLPKFDLTPNTNVMIGHVSKDEPFQSLGSVADPKLNQYVLIFFNVQRQYQIPLQKPRTAQIIIDGEKFDFEDYYPGERDVLGKLKTESALILVNKVFFDKLANARAVFIKAGAASYNLDQNNIEALHYFAKEIEKDIH